MSWFSHIYMCSGDQTQVKFNSKCLYLLSHLTGSFFQKMGFHVAQAGFKVPMQLTLAFNSYPPAYPS